MTSRELKSRIRIRRKQRRSTRKYSILHPHKLKLFFLHLLIVYPTQRAGGTTFSSTADSTKNSPIPTANPGLTITAKQSNAGAQPPKGSIMPDRNEHTTQPAYENTVHPMKDNTFQPTNESILRPEKEKRVQTENKNIPQPEKENCVKSRDESTFKPIEEGIGAQPVDMGVGAQTVNESINEQPPKESNMQPAEESNGQPVHESFLQTASESTVQLIEESTEQLIEESTEQSPSKSNVQSSKESTEQPSNECTGEQSANGGNLQSSKESATHPSQQSAVHPKDEHTHVQPSNEGTVQPLNVRTLQSPQENTVAQIGKKISVAHLEEESTLQPTKQISGMKPDAKNLSTEVSFQSVDISTSAPNWLLPMRTVEPENSPKDTNSSNPSKNLYTKASVGTRLKKSTKRLIGTRRTLKNNETNANSADPDAEETSSIPSTTKMFNRSSFDDGKENFLLEYIFNSSVLHTLYERLVCTNSTNSTKSSLRDPCVNWTAMKNFTSCHQRCGDDTTHPCSCNEKCLVHKNCCEDLASACPELHSTALVKFQNLLSAQIRCDPITVVYLVESCPSMLDSEAPSGRKKPDQNPTSMVGLDRSSMKDGPANADVIFQVLSNAPITDYETGIVYSNASVFKCNKEVEHLSSNQTLKVKKGTWRTQLGTIDVENPRELLMLNKLDLSSYLYLPPEKQPISAGSLCYNAWTSKCISELSKKTGVHNVACGINVKFYYRRSRNVHSVPLSELNAPDICVMCLSNYQETFQSARYFPFGFKVLMSLSETSGQVIYRLSEEVMRYKNQLVPWSSWTCRYPDNSTGLSVSQPGGPDCRVIQCQKNSRFSPDGFCRKIVVMEFAIQDGFQFDGRKCNVDPEVFAEVTFCFAQELFNLEVTEKPYRFFKLYQKGWNRNVTVVRMELYFGENYVRSDIFDLYTKIHTELDKYVRYFVSQYCSTENDLQEKKSHVAQNHIPAKNLRISAFYVGKKYGNPGKGSEVIIFSFCTQLNGQIDYLNEILRCDAWRDLSLTYILSKEADDPNVEILGPKCIRKRSFRSSFESKGSSSNPLFSLIAFLSLLGQVAMYCD